MTLIYFQTTSHSDQAWEWKAVKVELWSLSSVPVMQFYAQLRFHWGPGSAHQHPPHLPEKSCPFSTACHPPWLEDSPSPVSGCRAGAILLSGYSKAVHRENHLPHSSLPSSPPSPRLFFFFLLIKEAILIKLKQCNFGTTAPCIWT